MSTVSHSGPLEFEQFARNTAPDSENKIHDDAEARRYGFAGGLVPGVTLYAYLTRLAVTTFGAGWLERGTADCRFRRPVYEGETIRCEAQPAGDATPAIDVQVIREGVVCAAGAFSLTEETHDRSPAVPIGGSAPDVLPELTPDGVPLGVPLAPLHGSISVAEAAAYADDTDDPNPWYRGHSPFGGPLVPPGWLAARQAPLLRHNFRFGPSIHARSVIRHLAPAFAGRAYVTAGVIRETIERNGNWYLVLDAETRDDQDRLVYRVEHTTIYHVREAG
jgi:acyl dehydratase